MNFSARSRTWIFFRSSTSTGDFGSEELVEALVLPTDLTLGLDQEVPDRGILIEAQLPTQDDRRQLPHDDGLHRFSRRT